MTRTWTVAVVVWLSASILAIGCNPHDVAAANRPRAPRTTWLVFDRGGLGDPVVPAVPAGAGRLYVYVTGARTGALPRTMVSADLFTSFAAFRSALRAKELPKDLRYVAYDPEKWSKTPRDEQLDPIRYMAEFTVLARRHGLRAILAPARDLMLVHGATCRKHRGITLDQAFVHCDVAAGARGAGLFVIQSAPEESTPRTFSLLLRRVSRQVRRASPATTVVATLETGRVPVARLVRLADQGLRYVDGFEVNTSPSTMRTTRDLMRHVRG